MSAVSPGTYRRGRRHTPARHPARCRVTESSISNDERNDGEDYASLQPLVLNQLSAISVSPSVTDTEVPDAGTMVLLVGLGVILGLFIYPAVSSQGTAAGPTQSAVRC